MGRVRINFRENVLSTRIMSSLVIAWVKNNTVKIANNTIVLNVCVRFMYSETDT
jgi:hypothetical protein